MDYIISVWTGPQLANILHHKPLPLFPAVIKFIKTEKYFQKEDYTMCSLSTDTYHCIPFIATLVICFHLICLFGPGWSEISPRFILNPGVSKSL